MKNKRCFEEFHIEEKSDGEKLFKYLLILIGIVSLMIGGTYAFFLFTIGTDNVDVQSTDSITLRYSDNKVNMNDDLIPTSRENVLKGLVKDTDKCIDDYGFSACSLYEFTISNNNDVSQVINITMTPLHNEYKNLEFMLYSSKIEDINKNSIPLLSNQKLVYNSLSPISFNELTETILANDEVSYTLVFYILNINENQVEEDSNKNFRAKININSLTTGEYISNEISS